MSIQRWDPLRDIVSLREAMNNLLEESFVRPRAGMVAMTGGMAIDLRENDQAYIVESVIAGAKPEDVEISVLGDTLRIAVEVHDESDKEGEKWLLRERRFGRFERSLTLPAQVKADEASADFEHGILTITLPKAEAARPRSIPVRGTSTGQQVSVSEPTEIDVQSEPVQ
jgi:HSP20 family protein